jgi:hypothetical protein
VSQKPSGLVIHLQNPVQLMGAEALLAGTDQVNRLQAFVQRDMCRLKNGTDLDRELLAALFRVALPQAGPDFAVFALHALKTTRFPNGAAMRANRLAIGPDNPFQMGKSGGFVSEVLFCKN